MVPIAAGESLPAASTVVGTVAPTSSIEGTVSVAPRDPGALASYAAQVSEPGSPLFHHFLAAGQFRAQFGPTAATISAVSSLLTNQGLSASVSSNGLLVTFSGAASSVENTFATRLGQVRLRSGIEEVAPIASISVPSSLSGAVVGVFGLSSAGHESPSFIRGHALRPSTSTGAVSPSGAAGNGPHACGDATATAQSFGGLTDAQIATAYGADGLYNEGADGAGRNVAVFELEPFAMSDISAFATCYFGASDAASLGNQITVHPVLGGDPQGPGSGESALDIENILGLAPRAHIDVYEAPNSNAGVAAEYNQIVQDDVDSVISTSWGECEALSNATAPGLTSFENTVFEQAAIQGQSVFAASGDDGSSDCDPTSLGLAVDDPASQPYVTGVGATTVLQASNPPVETTWNDGANWGGSGGGISQTWSQPAWQKTALVPGIDNGTQLDAAATTAKQEGVDAAGAFCASEAGGSSDAPCRQVPDVSADGDEFAGAITVYEGGWTTIGGTSSAAPIWAALTADAGSLPACTSGRGIGFISPELYALASDPTTYAAAFNDISVGTNDVYGANDGLFSSTKGYDMASGLGSPKMTGAHGAPGLGALLCEPGSPTQPTVTSVSPGSVDPAGLVTATVTGSGFEHAGTPDIAQVQIGTFRVSPGSLTSDVPAFSVASPTQLDIVVPPAALQGITGAPSNLSAPSPYGPGRYDLTVSTTSGLTSPSTAGSILDYVAPGAETQALPSVTGVVSSGGSDKGGSTVTIVGSGFTGATGVTFGGVAATALTVLSDNKITVTVPAYASGTTSCVADGTNPATDVCQVHVVVTGPGGSSAEGAILAPTGGTLTTTCQCEIVPGPDEYDYFATPVLKSVTEVGPYAGYASELAGATVDVTGTGLDPFALISPVIGPVTQASSWGATFVSMSPTEVVITIPPIATKATLGALTASLEMATAASPDAANWSALPDPSNALEIKYAGVPAVTALSVHTTPTSGGETATLTGTGLGDVQVIDVFGEEIYTNQPPTVSVQEQVTGASNRSLRFAVPAGLPGPAFVSACSATGCASVPGGLSYFEAARGIVTGLSTHAGPAAGGDLVTVEGTNLGCALEVEVGHQIEKAHRLPSITGCGDTERVSVVMPSGLAGQQVALRVLTLEGRVTGSGFTTATPAAFYRYH